jgi:hypothetical protein
MSSIRAKPLKIFRSSDPSLNCPEGMETGEEGSVLIS